MLVSLLKREARNRIYEIKRVKALFAEVKKVLIKNFLTTVDAEEKNFISLSPTVGASLAVAHFEITTEIQHNFEFRRAPARGAPTWKRGIKLLRKKLTQSKIETTRNNQGRF